MAKRDDEQVTTSWCKPVVSVLTLSRVRTIWEQVPALPKGACKAVWTWADCMRIVTVPDHDAWSTNAIA